MGLDSAAMGSQCLWRGDPGKLRQYNHIELLSAGQPNRNVQAGDLAWPSTKSFQHSNVDMSQGRGVHFNGSLQCYVGRCISYKGSLQPLKPCVHELWCYASWFATCKDSPQAL